MNVVFGAGLVGEALYEACKVLGIKISCFCDNDISLNGTLLKGIPVIYPSGLKRKDTTFYISCADINDIVVQLKKLGYTDWRSCSLLKDFDLSSYKFSQPLEVVIEKVKTALLCHDQSDKVFVRSVEVIVTERCSLHCRDCSNLMRYYQHPVDTSLEEINKDMDRICQLTDGINEFRILGGEPFMNREVHLMIKRLLVQDKVRKVVIYTNGTIVPTDEQLEAITDPKVLFIITDYGKLSVNLERLKAKLEGKINYTVQKVGGWTDCNKIAKHNRKDNQKIFDLCCAKNTITISHGFLFRCPFAANANRLNAVPDFRNDKFDLNGTKQGLKKYLREKKYPNVCDYCNGRTFGDPEIEPAIQQLEVIKINV